MKRILAAILAIGLVVPAFAAELGDDGLYKPSWLRDTFKDLPEDIAASVKANPDAWSVKYTDYDWALNE